MKKKNQKNNIPAAGIQDTQQLIVKKFFIPLSLVLLGSLLFATAHPNLLFKNGLPFIAWFMYIPLLVVIKNNKLLPCIGWGLIYGYASYGIFNYWLGAFHPMAGLIVYGIYCFYLAVVFFCLKLADIFFDKRAYLVQWIIWIAYEYLQTKGFLGYPYGITGYTQWRVIPLIQIAGITGVWGVSALTAFPSFWIAAAINGKNGIEKDIAQRRGDAEKNEEEFTQRHEGTKNTKIRKKGEDSCTKSPCLRDLRAAVCKKFVNINFVKSEKVPAIIWAAALASSLVFGAVAIKNFSGAQADTAVIALVQHNTDPWEATKAPTSWQRQEAYRKDLAVLSRLSDEAVSSLPKPDLVVWPETAFVPRIYWHTNYRDDQDSWIIVRELLDYLSKTEVPFLIGNDDARKEPGINPNEYENYRVDYNAALLFENGTITGVYRKLHLVPFTEHFPYQKQLPFMHRKLVEADTHFWEKGTEETVFRGQGFTFSAPICFEDTFGYLSRNFVKGGADILVNLSNDAWSNSLPAQKQHLSMAVFRAVENYRAMVRSTATGQTCAINPIGRVIAEAPPFEEAWINVNVPIVKGNTIYNLYGDYLGFLFFCAAVTLLLFGFVWCRIKR
jgi:apolipoprotein N-acyltransferase